MKINIGISARHVHISEKDFKVLFPNEELNVEREMSQKPNFASDKKVTISNGDKKIENVRIVGEEKTTWNGVLPFKPYDCLTPSIVGNETRYSGWVLGDISYLDRRFGIRFRDVSNSEYISTSNKAINFCMFRTDNDTDDGHGMSQYADSCLIISDVITGESSVVDVDVPVYHTINENYLPIDKLTSSEIDEMFD